MVQMCPNFGFVPMPQIEVLQMVRQSFRHVKQKLRLCGSGLSQFHV